MEIVYGLNCTYNSIFLKPFSLKNKKEKAIILLSLTHYLFLKKKEILFTIEKG